MSADNKYIHFIGIGGAGMSSVAEIMIRKGHKISGSDLKINYNTKYLNNIGAKIYYGHNKKNIKNVKLVITSSAIPNDNPEIHHALCKNIPVLSRIEMLHRLMRHGYSIAISGTHGKTTVTAMLTSIYEENKLNPTVINGGPLKKANISGCILGDNKTLIAEIDESRPSFTILKPNALIITNIEQDHLNFYSNKLKFLKLSFLKLINNVSCHGLIVACIDNSEIKNLIYKTKRKIITYGFNKQADIKITNYKQHTSTTYFNLTYRHKTLNIKLKLPGKHNALNASAAAALALSIGIKKNIVASALKKFQGVNRRFDILRDIKKTYLNGKKLHNLLIISDYGHHPKEISITIETIRSGWSNRRLIMIFQPHRYTRTYMLYSDFVKVLLRVDKLILLDIYSANEKPIDYINSKSLCSTITNSGKRPIYINNLKNLPTILLHIFKDNDILLIQGAGDVHELTVSILKEKDLIH